MRGDFGWDYPPGVTGNEPQITGEWPCVECGGACYDEDEDGKHACPRCEGTGIEPEEDEDEAADSPNGRCDTCGAACDGDGCTVDRSHAAAIDPTEGEADVVD